MTRNTNSAQGGPLRRALISGLLFALPIAATFWIVGLIFNWADSVLGGVASALVRWIVPEEWLVGPFAGGYVPGLSFMLALLVLVIAGAVYRNTLGQRVLRIFSDALAAFPGVGVIYRNTRKVGDLLGDPKKLPFQRVALVPFLGPDSYAVAFVTGQFLARVGDEKRLYLRVAIPTPPNPVSCLLAIVPAEKAIDAGMTVEEGLQMCMSLGMVGPDEMVLSAGTPPQAN